MFSNLAIGVVGTAAVWAALLQLADAPVNVKIAKETTFVTAPLADDGLPNFALAILERDRKGVTPENNGARPFWQAIGPVDVTAEEYALLCKELGANGVGVAPLGELLDDEMIDQVAQWLAERSGDSTSAEALHETARGRIVELTGRPWRSVYAVPVAAQLEANEAVLDRLAESAAKPRFFSPPPNLLANPQTAVMDLEMPHVQAARSAVRWLSARAMNRIAEGKYDAAWRDTLACWRFGSLMGTGSTLIDKLVAMGFRGTARTCTLALLQSDDLPEPLARQILREVLAQPRTLDVPDSLDFAERLMFIDSALRQTTQRLGGVSEPGIESMLSFDDSDPDALLWVGNKWFDRVVAASKIKNHQERRDAMAKFAEDLAGLAAESKAKLLQGAAPNATGELLVALMLPAAEAATTAEDRDVIHIVLTQTAAALAIYRAQHQDYANSLDALVPDFLPAIPQDVYRDAPLVYERRGDGYLLYSVFQNGVDDGGTDFTGEIVRGEWAAEDQLRANVDMEQSDVVVRMPQPARSLSRSAP